MVLVFAAAALAADWSGPRVVGDDPPPVVSIVAGLGGSFLAGGNAPGYAGGLLERLALDFPTGDLVAFSLEIDHSRHALADAGAYFSSVENVPAGSLTGFRDYFVLSPGFRFAFPGGRPQDGVVTVRPFVLIGLGVAFTSTLLDGAGFDGRVALRSNTAWPAPSLAAGAEIRLSRRVDLLPHLEAQVHVFEDTAESVGGPSRVTAEWRFQPALDVRINF
jgi:hypothetical protein